MRNFCSLIVLFSATFALADDFPTPPNTEKATTAPMDPQEVCRTAKLPPGFEMCVFAAEPDVQNPIAITTDERGRLWVAENFSWAGAGFGGFNGEQRDRIVILEDTDGDGKHDKRTVFWDDARKLTSVEVGFGGVWAICLPNLLFIPDKNRDDIPDGPPVVVLDGFNEGVVGHTPANGLKWGPDGWLYGRHGIQATSAMGAPGATDSQRAKINTGIWRYHPTRKVVEAVMHGMTNSWGFDYDEHGEMFCINTVIGHLWHVVPGAHTERMYGVDINPHAYQLIKQCADHVHWDTGEVWHQVQKGTSDGTNQAGGGHAHCGLMIYQGDNWPQEYRGKAYTLNIHGRRINCDRLEREGCGFTAKHEPDFALFEDPWFRGMDLITGPDGGVFIADWSDTGECHDHDGVHRTSGRIYKLTYGKPEKLEPFDLESHGLPKLFSYMTSANQWWPRQARKTVQARVDRKRLDARAQREMEQHVKNVFPDDDNTPRSVLWRLWMGGALAGDQESNIFSLLANERGAVNEVGRVWSVRLVSDFVSLGAQSASMTHSKMVRLASIETSGMPLLYIASSMQRMPLGQRWEIAENLATKAQFANDRMFPIMLWLGIEPAVPKDPAKAIELAKNCQIPVVTQNIARRLTLEIERDPATVEKLLDLAIKGEAAHPQEIIVAMGLALQGWRKAPMPANWPQAAEKFSKPETPNLHNDVQGLAIVFGDGLAMEELQKIATNGGAEPESRRQALRALLAGKPDGFAPTLQNLCGDRAVNVEAIRGLALYDHPDTPNKIFGPLGIYSPEARSEMINTLSSRPDYAKALLTAVREGRIKPGEITAFHARQIRAFDNADLTTELTELWGDVRTSAADKKSLIETWKSKLNGDAVAKANLPAGRAVFEKSCKNCHVLYGNGRKVGPDLTGSNRKNLDYLLENILDPSASVGVDFRAVNVAMEDGRVLSGVISEQNDRTLTLQTDREPITIDRTEIAELKPTTNSLMPDGLLTTFSEAQVRDLIGYLQSIDQVPLPE